MHACLLLLDRRGSYLFFLFFEKGSESPISIFFYVVTTPWPAGPASPPPGRSLTQVWHTGHRSAATYAARLEGLRVRRMRRGRVLRRRRLHHICSYVRTGRERCRLLDFDFTLY
jgi:hypothetical protein